MCGFAGVVCAESHRAAAGDDHVAAMRDRLAHRGPDDAGLWTGPQAAIGHRRLVVVDPSPAGRQPMSTPDGRFVLAYNGELYNDASLRERLGRLGVVFRTACDTETVLHACVRFGPRDALRHLRGMYALALWDTAERTLTLARDPLGIKPLHYACIGTREIAFASEIPALLRHPALSRRPDWATLSAYLTTIRVTLDNRTVFDGVRTLRPGETLTVDARGPELRTSSRSWWSDPPEPPTGDTRGVIEDAVQSHLRADVPVGALLSGGLDSTIICSLASAAVPGLRTYCAGDADAAEGGDFDHAVAVSRGLGTDHREARITGALFADRWRALIEHNGTPLSTPNEVAINEVARSLRARGDVVALTGEGADELFGGYHLALAGANAWLERAGPGDDGGLFELESNAWIAPGRKAAVLRAAAYDAAERDEALRSWYSRTYAACRAAAPEAEPLQAHLRFQRAINLEGLLRRLDTATMAASVESRTPLADAAVAQHAEALPLSRKFCPTPPGMPPRTKIALREAFAEDVPPAVIERAKASFPLPFDAWIAEAAAANGDPLERSAWASEVFTPAAAHAAAARGGGTIAWPVLNLTLWAEAWL